MILVKDSSINPKSIENIDIPIINEDNAILYNFHDEEYRKTFKLSNIHSGITLHNNQYYYFNHNIVSTPHGFRSYDVQSYDIYKISHSSFSNIMESNYKIRHWELVFDNWTNHQVFYTYVKNGRSIEIKEFRTKIDGDKLYARSGMCPSSANEEVRLVRNDGSHGIFQGVDIELFLAKHRTDYPGQIYSLNKSLLRDMKISEVLAI